MTAKEMGVDIICMEQVIRKESKIGLLEFYKKVKNTIV